MDSRTCRYHRETNSSLLNLTEAELAYEFLRHERPRSSSERQTFPLRCLRAPVPRATCADYGQRRKPDGPRGRRHSHLAVRDCAFRAACAVSGCPRGLGYQSKEPRLCSRQLLPERVSLQHRRWRDEPDFRGVRLSGPCTRRRTTMGEYDITADGQRVSLLLSLPE